jgi:hypothetical protein
VVGVSVPAVTIVLPGGNLPNFNMGELVTALRDVVSFTLDQPARKAMLQALGGRDPALLATYRKGAAFGLLLFDRVEAEAAAAAAAAAAAGHGHGGHGHGRNIKSRVWLTGSAWGTAWGGRRRCYAPRVSARRGGASEVREVSDVSACASVEV